MERAHYFPSITFQEEIQPPAQIIEAPYELTAVNAQDVLPYPTFEALIDGFSLGKVEVEEVYTETSWSENDIVPEFVVRLKQMSDSLNQPLSLQRRDITFVTSEDIIPKDPARRRELIKTYGTYVLDGIAGMCTKHPDNTYSLQIGYKGQEEKVTKDEVLDTLAHEYGHSLGNLLENSVFEELKAYAFANLFFRYFKEVDTYVLDVIESSTVHQKAKYYLQQLIDKGIPEEAILAHLIGENFGSYTPESYRSFM